MRLFLDTNVIIIGFAKPDSPQHELLRWLGCFGAGVPQAQLITSPILQLEIRRVARRLHHKDWAGQILHQIWHSCELVIVTDEPTPSEIEAWQDRLPREDIPIYLTALAGKTDCFISSNHELIRAIAAETHAFACYKPERFVAEVIHAR